MAETRRRLSVNTGKYIYQKRSRIEKPAPTPKEERRKPRWMETCYKIGVRASEDQLNKLLHYVAVAKYAWNWAITEWQWREAAHRLGDAPDWPCIEDLLKEWRETHGVLHSAAAPCQVPLCVAEMSIIKLVNAYLFARIVKKGGPTTTPPRLGGSFRLEKRLCSVSEDHKALIVEGVGEMEFDKRGPKDWNWDDIQYVSFCMFSANGFVVYLVKSPVETQDKLLQQMTYENLDQAMMAEDLADVTNEPFDERGVTPKKRLNNEKVGKEDRAE